MQMKSFLPPEVSPKDIDENIDTLTDLVLQLNAAVPILCAVHKNLGQSVRKTLT